MSITTNHWRATAATVLAATAGLSFVSAASADTFAYRDGDDVKLVNADGSRGKTVIDGTPELVATLPVADGAGNVSAIMSYGKFSSPELRWVSADGTKVVDNLLPEVGAAGLNAGPLSVSIDPSGKLYAYTYLEWMGTSSAYRPHLAIVDPTAPGLPKDPPIDRLGYGFVDWFGDRLLASDGNGLFAERAGADRLVFDSWPVADGVDSVDISADGSRALLGAGSTVFLVALGGGAPPAAEVTAFCTLPSDGSDLYRGGAPSDALSPDGTRVAYSGQSGLKLSRIGSLTGEGGDCDLQDTTLISAKGGLPSSSRHTIPGPSAPPVDGPPASTVPVPTTTPNVPGTSTPGTPAPGTSKPGTSSRKTLKLVSATRKGSRVTVSLTCPKTCSYTLRLRRGKKTLATRKGKAKAGKATKVVLKGAKGKGLTVRLTVGGKTVSRKVK